MADQSVLPAKSPSVTALALDFHQDSLTLLNLVSQPFDKSDKIRLLCDNLKQTALLLNKYNAEHGADEMNRIFDRIKK